MTNFYFLFSIPKGTPNGLRSELFVMISNYEEDRVEQDLTGTCNDAGELKLEAFNRNPS